MSGPQKIESDKIRYEGDPMSVKGMYPNLFRAMAAIFYLAAAAPAAWGFFSTYDEWEGIFLRVPNDYDVLALSALCGFAALYSIAQMFHTLHDER